MQSCDATYFIAIEGEEGEILQLQNAARTGEAVSSAGAKHNFPIDACIFLVRNLVPRFCVVIDGRDSPC